jgi:hypothetical protein
MPDAPQPHPNARRYTAAEKLAIVETVCVALRAGQATWRPLDAEGMPNLSTYWAWLDANPELQAMHDAAKALGIDRYAEETARIAAQSRPGTVTKVEHGDEGMKTTETTADAVDRCRLEVDTRKWYLAKIAPKRYGDKLDVEHSGDVKVTLKQFTPPPDDKPQ